MAKFYIQTDKGLIKVGNDITLENIKAALGYIPSNFSGDFYDLNNNPFSNGADGEFNIVDENQNIIAIVDKDGIHSVEMTAIKSGITHNLTEKMDVSEFESIITVDESGKFVIEDENGNKGFILNKSGVEAKNFTTSDGVSLNDVGDIVDSIQDKVDSINEMISDDEDDRLIIRDGDGEVGLELNKDGLYVKDVTTYDNEGNPKDVLSQKADLDIVNKKLDKSEFTEIIAVDETGEFVIEDEKGNVGLKLNQEGLHVNKDVITYTKDGEEEHKLSEKANQSDVDAISVITSASVSVDSNVGTPSATVSLTGDNIKNKTLNFEFKNLKGEKGEIGYGIFYTNTEYNSDTISIIKSDIIDNVRTIQVGDFILSSNGNIFSIKEIGEPLNVEYLTSIKGIQGASVSSIVCVDGDNSENIAGVNNEYGAINYYRIKDNNNNFLEGTIAIKNGSAGSGGGSSDCGNINLPFEEDESGKFVIIDDRSDENIGLILDSEGVTAKDFFTSSDVSLNDVGDRLSVVEDSIGIELITYNNLVQLRNNSQLIPGQQYRITDYITTTSEADTQSAEHQFDIIVTALNENTLSEIASACVNKFDIQYFDSCNLSAWQIWYCLDNDTSRFSWANEDEGKGVIYRMIDEWGNDCPYDFKNIKFLKPIISETDTQDSNYYYTFCYYDGGDSISDASISGSDNIVFNNVIKQYSKINGQHLNRILFIGEECSWKGNTFGSNCFDNIFEDECDRNTFGESCYNNTFGYRFDNNTFGNNCYNNSFGGSCSNNTFGNRCYSNKLGADCCNNTFGKGCSNNTFWDECNLNTFGDKCCYNSLKNNCENNTFGNECNTNSLGTYSKDNEFGVNCCENTFGDECCDNTFGGLCSYNTFWDDCCDNTFGGGCSSNTFGNTCVYNTFGKGCFNNKLENDCWNNTFGDICSENTFGNNCYDNTFGNICYSNKLGADCCNNTFGNECEKNTFGGGCSSNTFGKGCFNNKLENECSYNTFGDICSDNTFGNNCYDNTFGNNCSSNTFGNGCNDNTFGNGCDDNTFGNDCNSNTFGNDCFKNTFGSSQSSPSSYYRYIIFDNGNGYINLYCTSTTSSSQYYQNVRIGLGVNNSTSTYKTISDSNVGQEYETLYKPVNYQTITI